MKTNILFLVGLFIIMFLFFNINKSYSQITDFDGNTYKTVTIGTQEWTAENLNVSHYRNGDVIPQIQGAQAVLYQLGLCLFIL